MHTLKSQACNGEANETNLTNIEIIENVITRTNNKLACHIEKQSAATAFRSKGKWYEYGEKSNKYFLRLNKKFKKQKLISKITCDESVISIVNYISRIQKFCIEKLGYAEPKTQEYLKV